MNKDTRKEIVKELKDKRKQYKKCEKKWSYIEILPILAALGGAVAISIYIHIVPGLMILALGFAATSVFEKGFNHSKYKRNMKFFKDMIKNPEKYQDCENQNKLTKIMNSLNKEYPEEPVLIKELEDLNNANISINYLGKEENEKLVIKKELPNLIKELEDLNNANISINYLGKEENEKLVIKKELPNLYDSVLNNNMASLKEKESSLYEKIYFKQENLMDKKIITEDKSE